MFILQVICCVVFIYGMLSLVQDISNEITYKKISYNMKIVVFAKELEKKLNKYIIELQNIKKINYYKPIVVIDLDVNDNVNKIKEVFINSELNVEVLSFNEGKKYIQKMM